MKLQKISQIAGIVALFMTAGTQSFAVTAGSTSGKACIQRIGSMDIGSGSTKARVYDVNTCRQTAKQVYPEPGNKAQECEAKSNLPFKANLGDSIKAAKAKDKAGQAVNWAKLPRFSDELIEDGVSVPDPCGGPDKMVNAEEEIKRLTDLLNQHGAEAIVGVATEAFRESQNSDRIVDYLARKLGMKILIPSGAQEALIEWMSATAQIKSDPENKDVNPVGIITLGIGNGSMQIGAKGRDGSFAAFASTLASDNIKNYTIQKLKGGSPNILPLNQSNIDQIVRFAMDEANKASKKVKNRIGGGFNGPTTIVGVGGVINKSLRSALIGISKISEDRDFFTDRDVETLLYHDLVNQTVDSPNLAPISNPKYRQELIPNVALIYGVMKSLGITTIHYSDVDNTWGAIFFKDYPIKMDYVRPAQLLDAVIAARDHKDVDVEASVKSSVQDTTVVSQPVASSDSNKATCDAAPKKDFDGQTCHIRGTCWPFTDGCSNASSAIADKVCRMDGKVTLVYDMCSGQ